MSDHDEIDALLDAAIALQKPPRDYFPWENVKGGEDRVAPEQMITRLYESLRLKPPRFTWAPSPAAMYAGINMLRTIQKGQRYLFIEGLVRADDIDGAAKRTVLEAIIDRTITTTMGGCIVGMIPWVSLKLDHLWPTDLRRFLASHRFTPQGLGPSWHNAAPSVNEVTLYPADYFVGPPLAYHTLSFVPYTHLCWICLPPIEAQLYDDNHLAMMRFRDGYQINLPPVETLDEGDELPALTGEVDESPIETRRVLFAMCAIGQHRGCSGKISEGRNLTLCSCECHQEQEQLPGECCPSDGA